MSFRFATYFPPIMAVVMLVGPLTVAEAASPKVSQALYCQRFEQIVKKRCTAIKSGKITGRAAVQCKLYRKRFISRCAAKQVCGQPPFRCRPGFACATVMPPVKTYPSLMELKRARATLLYYGACEPSLRQ